MAKGTSYTVRTQNEEQLIENKISYSIRGAAFKIYSTLGPGLLESVYNGALSYELTKSGHNIKSVETLMRVHYKQLLTYLRLTGKKLGMLINFNETNLQDGIKRIVNGL